MRLPCMEPLAPPSGGQRWWPEGLGQPASSGAQGETRYAFFPDARRLLVERDGTVTTYDSGDHLHPSDAGYAAMAQAVDLRMLLDDR